jgi:RNA polymerase sigma-70 factor (ECF subfamily)
MIENGELQVIVTRGPHASVDSLESLLAQYETQLVEYAARQIPQELKGAYEPQDVIQDTFLEAFRRLHEFEPLDTDSAWRWLRTIARTRISNAQRSHTRLKRGGGLKILKTQNLAVSSSKSLVCMLAELAVYTRTPSQSAMAHELAAALEGAIERLHPDHQQAIRLKYIDGTNMNSIATALGRTPAAAQMLCNRGLKALRRELRSKSRFG